MSAKTERTRRMKISAGAFIDGKTGWSNAHVILREWTGKEWHECIITVETPWQLHYLRSQLSKIEEGWREKLEQYK